MPRCPAVLLAVTPSGIHYPIICGAQLVEHITAAGRLVTCPLCDRAPANGAVTIPTAWAE